MQKIMSALNFEGATRYRLGYLWWPEVPAEGLRLATFMKTPMFHASPRVYIEGIGYVLASNPEVAGYSKGGKKPEVAIGTVVVEWPTDEEGRLDGGRFRGGDFKVWAWVFGEGVGRHLMGLHDEHPAGLHDIVVYNYKGDGEEKNLIFRPAPDNLLRLLVESEADGEDLVRRVMEAAKPVIANIQAEIGEVLTPAEIEDRLATPIMDLTTIPSTGWS